jgi:ubiquinone/menaquinone biosynthesis C-methylase UbiE
MFPDNSFDVINCERTICYLPEKYADKVIGQLKRVSKKYIVFTIICADHVDPNLPVLGAPGRKNINTKAYWKNLFAKHELNIDEERTATMRGGGWDCIWVVTK